MAFHVIQNPAGTYSYVGKVPAVIDVECSNPEYIKIAIQCGPGFARKAAEREGGVFKTRTFPSKEAAIEYAEKAGFKVG